MKRIGLYADLNWSNSSLGVYKPSCFPEFKQSRINRSEYKKNTDDIVYRINNVFVNASYSS
jgi:hypothetical protein